MIGLLLAAAIAASPPKGGVLPGEQAEYDAILAAQTRAANKAFVGHACNDAKIEVVSIRPSQITDHPELIVWREKARATGCGHSLIDNVNVGRMGGNPPWKMTVGLPGDTLADTNLQSSTFLKATAQVKASLSSECQKVSLDDVYVAARRGDVDIVPPGSEARAARKGRPSVTLPSTALSALDKPDLSSAWMEVWPFKGCGHDRTLGVVFVPLKDRTTSVYVFLPVWQQIEAHGPGARPAAAPSE